MSRSVVLNQDSGLNRRRFPRKSFKNTVSVLCKGTIEFVVANEIGEGGLSFETDLVYNVGEFVVLNFYIPGGDLFFVRSEVKNNLPSKDPQKRIYGFGFIEVNLPLKRQIRAYVARTSS